MRTAVRCNSSPAPRLRVPNAPPTRDPLPATPAAGAPSTEAGEADISTWAETLNSFAIALATVYGGMGVAPALAVPEALVEAFKSKPISLVHPVVMWTVFGSVLYTFYLGWQTRSIRSATPEVRKTLVKAKVAQRHFRTSSTLFAIMTCTTFAGMGNTYARTGKLFPGPHLYGGLGLVALMAVMSSLVPNMQAGRNWAKQVHFALAFPVLGLFAWQAQSGMVIVGKLLGWS